MLPVLLNHSGARHVEIQNFAFSIYTGFGNGAQEFPSSIHFHFWKGYWIAQEA